MSTAVTVARIYTRGRMDTMWPWLVLLISLTVNAAIFAVGQGIPVRESGGVTSLFVGVPFAVLAGWKQMLPFVVGLSVTRAGFLRGSLLFFGGQAVLAGVLLTALGSVERATDGWGIAMEFFQPFFLGDLGVAGRFAVFASLFACMGALGAALAAARTRWGAVGLWVASLGAIGVLGAIAVGITWADRWPATLTFLGERGILELTVGYPLVTAVILAVGAWAIVRRVPVR